MNTRKLSTVAGLVLALIVPNALAQSATTPWPNKHVRVILPYAPGGGPERVTRTIADGLSKRLGQPVVLENKAGASGNIGFADLARAQPDGYTWLLGPDPTWTINPHVYKNTGFKTADVPPVSLVSSLSFVLACHPSVGVKNAQELVQRAKTKNLSYATSGLGSSNHVTTAMMLEAGQFEMTHVPYRGPGPAVADLLGGQVDCSFLPVSSVQEHIKSGRLIGIATATKYRPAALPDLPTLHEQGFKDFDATFYVGMFAPRGVPQDILTKFQKALDETVRSPEVQEAFAANSNRFEGLSADAAMKELQRVSTQWQGLAKRLNLALD